MLIAFSEDPAVSLRNPQRARDVLVLEVRIALVRLRDRFRQQVLCFPVTSGLAGSRLRTFTFVYASGRWQGSHTRSS